MENEVVVFSKRLENTDEETFAQSFIRYVNLELDEIKRNFVKIGFRLNEANKFEYYKELGYNNITELAEAEFGFKHSTTYALMKISNKFCAKNDPMCLADKYKGFSYSQLLVLSSAINDNFAFWAVVKSSDSVRKLKSFVLNWNYETKRGCAYHPECKTVDDYLQYAEEHKVSPKIEQAVHALMFPDSESCEDKLSNRLESEEDVHNDEFSKCLEKESFENANIERWCDERINTGLSNEERLVSFLYYALNDDGSIIDFERMAMAYGMAKSFHTFGHYDFAVIKDYALSYLEDVCVK